MTARAEVEECRHPESERAERISHGYLGDAPAGTRQLICEGCGAVLDVTTRTQR